MQFNAIALFFRKLEKVAYFVICCRLIGALMVNVGL